MRFISVVGFGLVVMAGLFSCSAERLARKAYRKDPTIFNVIYRPVEFTLKMDFDTLETAKYIAKLDTFFLDKNWPDTIERRIIEYLPAIVEEAQQIPMNSDTISKVWPDSSWARAWVHQGDLFIDGELASITVQRPEKLWEKVAKIAIGFAVGVVAMLIAVVFLRMKF